MSTLAAPGAPREGRSRNSGRMPPLATDQSRHPALTAVATAGGVSRLRDLRDSGYSRRTIDSLRASGELLPAGRGWVSTRDADPYLIAAARAGVVITCVTAAARLGLWVPEGVERAHVAAPATSSRATSLRAQIHWATPLVPRHPAVLVDPIENVLHLVAACQPYEDALAVWESALHQRLVDLDALRGYPWRPAARRLLAEAQPWSDAGLETYVVPRLRWLRLPLRRQTWLHGHRVDLLIGDRLVFQIDGSTHVGAQRDSDNAHDGQLRLRGYTVIRVGYRQVMHDWAAVQELIMRAVAQGLHLAR